MIDLIMAGDEIILGNRSSQGVRRIGSNQAK